MRDSFAGAGMVRRKATFVALLAAGLGSATSAEAGGLWLYEVGTQDVGLASAGYGARAQDASTVLTNPAGMTRLQGANVTLGTQALIFDAEFSRSSGTSPELGTDNGGNPIGLFPAGSAFYTEQLSQDISVGMGVAGYFGLAVDYNDDWVGRYYVRKGVLTGISLLPSIAWKVNDKLSLGASLNAMYGSNEVKVAVNNISGPDGALKLDDNQWGWGANLGVMYEFKPGTRLGVTYTSEIDLKFKPNTEFSNLAPGLEALLDSRGLLNTQVDLTVHVPQTLMVSFFDQVNDKWALMSSVGWQDWSRFGEVQVGIDSNDPQSITKNLPFKDTWHGAFGAQYQLSAPWRLNMGVAYDTAFQKGSTISPMLPANSVWRFGIGAQNQVSNSFHWGVSAEYDWGGDLDVDVTSAAPVAVGGRGDVVGTFKNSQSLFLAADFGWQF